MTNTKPDDIKLKIEKKDHEDGKIQLMITVPADKVEELMRIAAFVLARQNRMDLIEIDADEVQATVINTVGEAQYNAFANQYVMDDMVAHALTKKQIVPIIRPEVNPMEALVAGRSFTFSAVVTPKPRFKLSSYDPVTVKLPKITVTEEEIDKRIFELAESNAQILAEDDAEVAENSEVTFAIKTTLKDNEEAIPLLTDAKRVYRMGEGMLPRDFDENLLGMKAGESRTFNFELPMQLNEDGSVAQTATAIVTIDLTQINKRVVPAINNAWIKENMPEAKDVDGLREIIREQGMSFKTQEQEEAKFYLVVIELAERLQGTIPDEIYENMYGEVMANMNARLRQQGMTFRDYLQSMDMDAQEFNMQLMLQVGEMLRQGLSLDALALHRKMVINEEDIEDALSRMNLGNEQGMREEFIESGRMYMLTEATMRIKANKWLVDTATFEIVE